MKIGIMQPYIFPYIGYFQLIHSVDKFILLDDVNFINKGWINRNKIVINNEPSLFTIPLNNASQNRLIKDITIATGSNWRERFLKTLLFAYRKTPYFDFIFPLIRETISIDEDRISKFIYHSINRIINIVGVNTIVIPSSAIYETGNLKGQDKIIDICLKEKASVYINPAGGTELYSKEQFSKNGVQLFFIKPVSAGIKNNEEPPLSIIHLLMNYSCDEIRAMLDWFTLE